VARIIILLKVEAGIEDLDFLVQGDFFVKYDYLRIIRLDFIVRGYF